MSNASGKFIHKVSREITTERLNEIRDEILTPKMETTQYYQDLAKMPNIDTLPKFRFLKYEG